jgi:hypothetical protein
MDVEGVYLIVMGVMFTMIKGLNVIMQMGKLIYGGSRNMKKEIKAKKDQRVKFFTKLYINKMIKKIKIGFKWKF